MSQLVAALILRTPRGRNRTRIAVLKDTADKQLNIIGRNSMIIGRGVVIKTVMRDILALTKLNYNACLYGDGLPVTLRFSDKIGDILTAIPDVNWAAKPFKYYI